MDRPIHGDFPIYDFRKAMFLVLCAQKPVRTEIVEGRTAFWFNTRTRPYVRVWDSMNKQVMASTQSGIVFSPDELDALQNKLWDALDVATAEQAVAQ